MKCVHGKSNENSALRWLISNKNSANPTKISCLAIEKFDFYGNICALCPTSTNFFPEDCNYFKNVVLSGILIWPKRRRKSCVVHTKWRENWRSSKALAKIGNLKNLHIHGIFLYFHKNLLPIDRIAIRKMTLNRTQWIKNIQVWIVYRRIIHCPVQQHFRHETPNRLVSPNRCSSWMKFCPTKPWIVSNESINWRPFYQQQHCYPAIR